MKIILGADHGGFEVKEVIKNWLINEGLEVQDAGAANLIPEDDFVDYAKKAIEMANMSEDKLVLFCRNGFGMQIAANRFTGVRCGLAFDAEAVCKGRTDDDINALSVPSDYVSESQIKEMVKVFIEEKFSGEDKYKRRVIKLDNLK